MLQYLFHIINNNIFVADKVNSNANSNLTSKTMDGESIDFGMNGAVESPKGDASQQTDSNLANQEDTTSLSGEPNTDINADGNQEGNKKDNNGEGSDNNSSTGELEPGTAIEFDGKTYTVADNGDLVDEKGNVFKNANDVKAWLEENTVEDSTDDNADGDLSITSIINALGVDVTDEDGKPVEFTNDAAGVKSYIDSVIDIKSSEIAEGAINKLFADNPMLKDFIDYVQLTGTPRGFGDIPDRSGIELDKDNEAQLIAVIKMAASEFGNDSLNDNYIKYLQSAGALYDEAKVQLENLVAKDEQTRELITQRAEEARQAEIEELTDYWQSVYDAINKRVIAGYKLPDSIVKTVNGQKVTYTPNDFYDYLSRPTEVDENGNPMTQYQRDLENMSAEDTLNRDLLSAWLMFTDGSYKDLVAMAVNEENVRKLKVKAKETRSNRTIKVVKPKNTKVSNDDILF